MFGIAGVVARVRHENIPHPREIDLLSGEHPGDTQFITGPGVQVVEFSPPGSPVRFPGQNFVIDRAMVGFRRKPVPDKRDAMFRAVVEELPTGISCFGDQNGVVKHDLIVLAYFFKDAWIVVAGLSQALDIGRTELFHDDFSRWGQRPGLRTVSRTGSARGMLSSVQSRAAPIRSINPPTPPTSPAKPVTVPTSSSLKNSADMLITVMEAH